MKSSLLIPVFVGWLSKAIVIIFTLINTKLIVKILGIEGFATYAIIASLTTWIALLNFGLPYSVQSIISKYKSTRNNYNSLVSTAIILVLILILCLFPVIYGITYLIKIFLLKNFTAISFCALFIVLVFMLFSSLAQIFTQIMFAELDKFLPNILPAVNIVLIFIGLYVLLDNQIYNFNIVLITIFFPNAIIFIITIYRVLKIPSILVINFHNFLEIYRGAKGYLLFAIMSSCTLAVDYMVMSQLIESSDIAKYNITGKIFGVLLSIHAVLIANNWARMSDELHSNKYYDARKRIHKLLFIGLLGVLAGGFSIIYCIGWIVPSITDGEIGEISTSLLWTWLMYIILRVWSDTYSMGLMSFNKMSIMNRYIPLQALLSVFSQITLGYYYGVIGILCGVILSYSLTAAWILPLWFYRETENIVGKIK